jgi:DNA-binding NarL/FixJ family response regulator
MAKIRLLLVDDVPQVRQDLRTALLLTGSVDIVGEAEDGLTAIALEQALTPDVVLMDLEMPALDGFDAARAIKSRRPSCRIVALSVHAADSDRLRAAQAGIDAFVVKGASFRDLLSALVKDGELT